MLTLLFLFVSSFALTLLITPVIRRLGLRLGWVDRPDAKRKMHAGPIARVGGVAVFASYLAAIGLLALTSLRDADAVQEPFRLVFRLLPATAIIFATGFLDDRMNLRPWQKLIGQLAASILVCSMGVHIRGIAWAGIGPWIGVPLTILWLTACTNAFNLIDGLDGLASGIGLFATLTTFAAAVLHGDFGLALATAPLAGALAGFLRFNFSPATVFLGDAGSLTVGFLLGCWSIMWSQKSATMLGMAAPLMALAVPLCDTALTIARRLVRSKPIFGADRAHIHHRLLDLGLTPRRVVLLLYCAAGAAACLALLQSYLSNELRRLVLFVFCAGTWLGIRRLGYDEFRAVGELLRLRLLRDLLNDQLRLRSLEGELAAAPTADDCWRTVRDSAREFGFNSVALQLDGKTYKEPLRVSLNGEWSVQIPVNGSSYVHLTHDFGSSEALAIARFAEFLHRGLGRNSVCRDCAKDEATRPRTMAAGAGPSRVNAWKST